jgi:hypothetical protein
LRKLRQEWTAKFGRFTLFTSAKFLFEIDGPQLGEAPRAPSPAGDRSTPTRSREQLFIDGPPRVARAANPAPPDRPQPWLNCIPDDLAAIREVAPGGASALFSIAFLESVSAQRTSYGQSNGVNGNCPPILGSAEAGRFAVFAQSCAENTPSLFWRFSDICRRMLSRSFIQADLKTGGLWDEILIYLSTETKDMEC